MTSARARVRNGRRLRGRHRGLGGRIPLEFGPFPHFHDTISKNPRDKGRLIPETKSFYSRQCLRENFSILYTR